MNKLRMAVKQAMNKLLPEPLILYGDGEHDDHDALEALWNGKRVRYVDGTRAVSHELRGGKYYFTDTLHVGRS